MSYLLKDILPAHIKKLNVTVAEFEKMSGLNRNTVQNILRGNSLHPTLNTLQKIAHTLECDIKDLIDNKGSIIKKHNDMSSSKPIMFYKIENYMLMNEIISYALTQLQKHHITPQADEFFNSISEIYQYCIEGDKITFDKKFSDWVLSKHFYKNNQDS